MARLSVKKSAIASPRRTVVVDAGPIKAAIDRGDTDHAWAVGVMRGVSGRFATCEAAIAEAQQWAPRMDFADACAVVLVRSFEHAFVLTTDFREFSTYRVPFASPEGAFHV